MSLAIAQILISLAKWTEMPSRASANNPTRTGGGGTNGDCGPIIWNRARRKTDGSWRFGKSMLKLMLNGTFLSMTELGKSFNEINT